MSSPEVDTVPCGLCGTPTDYKGTRRCDPCWELERRIKINPELARKILDSLRKPEASVFDGRPLS